LYVSEEIGVTTMKLGVFIFAALIFVNFCTCTPRDDMAKDASYGTTVSPRQIRALIPATDGRNGPPSNDQQCPLGTYPNCKAMHVSKH